MALGYRLSSGSSKVTAGRVSTGTVAANSTASLAVNLPVAQADTNYTVSVTVEDSTNSLRVLDIVSRSTTQCTVRVQNTDTLTAHTGTLHVVVVHD